MGISAISAGKEVLRLAKEHLARKESFAVETTLSGKNYLQMMQYARAIERGFEVVLIYIGTRSVEIHLARIAKRVRAGGHNVPEPDVRRRYLRSFSPGLRPGLRSAVPNGTKCVNSWFSRRLLVRFSAYFCRQHTRQSRWITSTPLDLGDRPTVTFVAEPIPQGFVTGRGVKPCRKRVETATLQGPKAIQPKISDPSLIRCAAPP
jgi:hypothetical protein